MRMNTTKRIVKDLGSTQIQRELGVGASAVSMAVKKGVFPAAWYDVLDKMVVSSGGELPRGLFNWKKGSAPKVMVRQEGDHVPSV